jgi:hypothetical protein
MLVQEIMTKGLNVSVSFAKINAKPLVERVACTYKQRRIKMMRSFRNPEEALCGWYNIESGI